MSSSNNELTELELRVATLIRKHSEQREALQAKILECDRLLERNTAQTERIHQLEQSLSVASVTNAGSPIAREALESLERELAGITEVIDECITLLEGRIE